VGHDAEVAIALERMAAGHDLYSIASGRRRVRELI
jgi:hypothetical protein